MRLSVSISRVDPMTIASPSRAINSIPKDRHAARYAVGPTGTRTCAETWLPGDGLRD